MDGEEQVIGVGLGLDPLKAEVGVSSRGELVAKLFAERYEPVNVEDVVRVDATA